MHSRIFFSQTHAYCESPDIVLVGNKNDLDHIRVVTESRARCLAEKYNLPYIETSAATGQNVQRSVDILLERVMARMEMAVDRSRLPGRYGPANKANEAEASRIQVQHCNDNKKCSC